MPPFAETLSALTIDKACLRPPVQPPTPPSPVTPLCPIIQKLLHSRLGARWSDVDATKSLKAGIGDRNICREQRSYCVMGTTLGQVHT